MDREQSPRLTRAQRRVQRKVEKQQSKERTQRNKLVRKVAGTALVIAALGVAAIGYSQFIKPSESIQPATTTPPSADLIPGVLSIEDTFNREIHRLGINKSPKEIALWQNEGFGPKDPRKPINHSLEDEAKSRVRLELELMRRSENKLFSEASNRFLPMWDQGKANVLVDSSGQGSGDEYSPFATAYPEIKESELTYNIIVDGKVLVYRATSIRLALSLVHEIEHINNIIQTDQPHRNTPVQSRFEFQYRRSQDLDDFVREEARGHGRETEAFIIQAGLMGVRDRDSSGEEKALEFIKFGSRVDSPGWLDYIKRTWASRGVQARIARATLTPRS